MREVAQQIYDIIKDYRNEDGIYITIDNIMEWACQFGDDALFMLEELLHLLKKVYCSKDDAYQALRNIVNKQYKDYGFSSFEEYLQSTCFLRLQPEGKSQTVLIDMLDELVKEKTGKCLADYASYPKRLFVYLDDILATGGTIRRNLLDWLAIDNHAEHLVKKEIQLELSIICVHTWGLSFLQYGLSQAYPELKIPCRFGYEIQNHLKLYNQDLNIAIPVKKQPVEIQNYLASLTAKKYEEYAYRDEDKPAVEVFFTSAENRVRYENLLLEKGLHIIRQIKGEVNPNIRPLGLINPNYKTFGLGTHFFTWRNVPNNCPLVFWWNVEGHGWKPLFLPKRNG